jgi:hypothetical protein
VAVRDIKTEEQSFAGTHTTNCITMIYILLHQTGARAIPVGVVMEPFADQTDVALILGSITVLALVAVIEIGHGTVLDLMVATRPIQLLSLNLSLPTIPLMK